MKLHPFTVLYRGISRGVALGSVGFFAGTSLGGAGILPSSLVGFPLALLGFLAGVSYETARYHRFEYELTADTLDLQSGVFSRRQREIPLRRVQNVDISRSVIQRALGIAAVNVETAGGGETEASLQYVGVEEARRLQTEIRERRAASKAGERREVEAGEQAGESPMERDIEDEETLFELSDRELVLLSVLSFDLRALSALFFLAPFLGPLVAGAIGRVAGGALVALVSALAVGLVFVLWLVGAVATFAQFYGFRLTQLGDELRYERGLLQRRDGSIPLDKLQSVAIEENLLMRQFGYAALSVETAGYAPGQSPSGGSEAAVPLARRERVLKLAREIEPFEAIELDQPPKRAQRRYTGRYALAILGLTGGVGLVDAFLVDLGPWYLLAALAAIAPVAARARWKNLGYALGQEHALAREGFWRRRTVVVPYYRIQTVITRRTVFQRRWGLSTLLLDTAGSQGLRGRDGRFVDIDTDDAEKWRARVREQLVAALRERS